MATAAVAPQVGNAEVGEAQRVFAQEASARAQELKDSGMCQPYTIINFNPVEVGLQGELKRYKVWTSSDGRLPDDVFRPVIQWEGKARRGHGLTIRDPHMFGKMVGASSAGNPGEVISQREVKWFTPQAIAYAFMEHFSPIFTAKRAKGSPVVLPPAPKDARRIFGLLVFEGDIHTLNRLMEEEDPAKRIIRVPVCHMQTIGKTPVKTYRTVEFPLDEYLEEMFKGQRKFADATVARAQQKWSETETIADISETDRMCFRWLIVLGYAKTPAAGEKTWLNEYLVLSDSDTKATSGLRKCPGCRAVEPEADTPFCPKCNRPMDVFKTFMAGHVVPESYLQTLEGDEREAVIAELRRRRQGFDLDASAPAATAPAPAKSGKGGKKKEAAAEPGSAEQIPTADTVVLPGEEADPGTGF